jgi:DNA segregation ATPase FtsK/SpoIIIE, S-DNA-T family
MTAWFVIAVLALLAGSRPVYAVVMFVLLPRAAKRNYPAAVWARFRWRWLCACLHLAYVDQHHRRKLRPRLPGSSAVHVHPQQIHLQRFPRARFRADVYGLAATVKTVPKAGRDEFEQVAGHLANAWRCHRVQIAQPSPGRLIVRGLRTDPLAEPFGIEDVPAGVYGPASLHGPFRVYLGRDEWGAERWGQLANITGAVLGGQPGTGKTNLANSVLMQFASSPAVQFAIADGQGGADFHCWRDRSFAYAGDDPAAAAAVLEDVHALMRHRFATVLEVTGHKNAWHAGPSERFPLVLLIVDEAGNYLDESAARGQPHEKHVRTCRAMLSQLVRRGRSVMIFTVLISQKPTSDQIPTQVRDNAALRLCGAVQTIDAAVSVLGESIRSYPTVSPVALSAPEDAGIFTAQLRTAGAPYVRLRVPEITEDAAAARARLTAPLCRDPRLPVPVAPPAAESPAASAVA